MTCEEYPVSCQTCAVECVNIDWLNAYFGCTAPFAALTACVSAAPALGCHNDTCLPELQAYTACAVSACGPDTEHCMDGSSYWVSCTLDATSHPGCSGP